MVDQVGCGAGTAAGAVVEDMKIELSLAGALEHVALSGILDECREDRIKPVSKSASTLDR